MWVKFQKYREEGRKGEMEEKEMGGGQGQTEEK